MLNISLLGGFSVTAGGEVIPDDAWRLRKAKTLVKWLALAPERRLHADRAAESLWADRDPDSARNNLHQAIFAARRALDSNGADGSRYLELNEDLMTLCPNDPVRIDVIDFEEAAARAREGRDPTTYREALDSYEGELLPEDRYEEWTASRRDALRELRLALAIELAELEAPADRGAAIGRLREVLIGEPLHEPAHRALMRLYAGGGRRQEALAQFQELKRGLRREFEDEPDDETRRLYQEILTRSLEPERRAGAGSPPPPAADELHRPRARAERDHHAVEGLETPHADRRRRMRQDEARASSWPEQRFVDFPDGVWPVELAAVGEPELIGPAIAQALDMRLASDRAPEVALAGHIGDREQMLLLDNCEHLVQPVAHLAEALLRHCPNLTLLATSREPLRVPGEVTWRVPSLSLPRLEDGSISGEVLDAESVRLFTARAGQAAPGFELDDDNALAIATLCHRLDGMPLAIELAAARVSVLTPAQIVERLDDSLDLLSTGSRTAMTRQQTLRATLAWSFDLLDVEEQVLLRRLSVFAGSFGLEAAEDICAEEPLERSEAVATPRTADRQVPGARRGGIRRTPLPPAGDRAAVRRGATRGGRGARRLRASPSRVVRRAGRERPDSRRRPSGEGPAAAAGRGAGQPPRCARLGAGR